MEGGIAGPIFENLKAIGTVIPDAKRFNSFEYTLVGSILVANPVGLAPGQFINFRIKQSMGGGWAVRWDTLFKFFTRFTPTMTAADGAVDMYCFYYAARDIRLEGTYVQDEGRE